MYIVAFCTACDKQCGRCSAILNSKRALTAHHGLNHIHSMKCHLMHRISVTRASEQGLDIDGDPDVVIIPGIKPIEQRS